MAPGISSLLAIEIARIDASGASVIAGRAPPNHQVAVLANGREIARVTATDEGQWAAVILEGISPGPLELTLESRPKDGGTPVRSAARQLVVPDAPSRALAAAPAARSASPKSASVEGKEPAQKFSPQKFPPQSGARPRIDAQGQAPHAAQAKGDASSSKRALAEFEALVERTRKEVAAQQAARPGTGSESGRSASASAPPPAAQMPSSVASAPASGAPAQSAAAASPAPAASFVGAKDAAARPSVPPSAPETRLAAALPSAVPASAPTPAAAQAPIPVPITFVTDDTTLTQDGARAAALLAEYVRLKRPAGITLSGHADARGSDDYNMELSQRRLEAIQNYLRAAGYSGALSLLPRGKREPYMAIDRDRLAQSDIYQADRRVELRLTP
jgi:outer membrane protein OmpA-like peptidoglycan-associated protein